MKKHNFYAGPAILADEVKKQAAEAAIDFAGTGLSLLEVSHRSKEVAEFMAEAEALVKEHLRLPDNYSVLFLTGGASTQFFMAPMNILKDGEKAAYVDTGSWSAKAIKEAKLYGDIEVVASSKEATYNFIPKNFTISPDSAYLHLTSNNTIYGTQFQSFPNVDVPIVADMSSDIFSRHIPIEKFGIIYAGAQKNIGPSGTTLVIVKNDLLERSGRTMPSMLNYKTHVEKNSLYNTAPIFPIYVCYLTLKWVKQQGGIDQIASRNERKAQTLYDEIDRNGLFAPHVPDVVDRSKMNVTFTMKDDTLSPLFLEQCQKAGIVGIKGHRSVGGFRASIYNAMDIESIHVLVDVMKYFEQKNG